MAAGFAGGDPESLEALYHIGVYPHLGGAILTQETQFHVCGTAFLFSAERLSYCRL